MRILVINVRSVTVKFSVTDIEAGEQTFKGEIPVTDQDMGPVLDSIPGLLERGKEAEVAAIGHRVVHGGERFRQAVVIDDDVFAAIEALNPLAPLHNPPALAGIRIVRRCWPKAPQVAVFDPAFHGDMPEHAATYAVPRNSGAPESAASVSTERRTSTSWSGSPGRSASIPGNCGPSVAISATARACARSSAGCPSTRRWG
jgi:acetate kinase